MTLQDGLGRMKWYWPEKIIVGLALAWVIWKLGWAWWWFVRWLFWNVVL